MFFKEVRDWIVNRLRVIVRSFLEVSCCIGLSERLEFFLKFFFREEVILYLRFYKVLCYNYCFNYFFWINEVLFGENISLMI